MQCSEYSLYFLVSRPPLSPPPLPLCGLLSLNVLPKRATACANAKQLHACHRAHPPAASRASIRALPHFQRVNGSALFLLYLPAGRQHPRMGAEGWSESTATWALQAASAAAEAAGCRG